MGQMRAFEANLRRLLRYQEVYGHANPPVRYRSPDGFPLGYWVQSNREAAARGTLSPHRTGLLLRAGVRLDGVVRRGYGDGFERRLAQLEEFARVRGHVKPAPQFLTDDGFALGKWLQAVLEQARAGTLPPARRRALVRVGVALPGSQATEGLSQVGARSGAGPGLAVVVSALPGSRTEPVRTVRGTALRELGLARRTSNALLRHGVSTVEQVLDMAATTGFGEVYRFGPTCVADVDLALQRWQHKRSQAVRSDLRHRRTG